MQTCPPSTGSYDTETSNATVADAGIFQLSNGKPHLRLSRWEEPGSGESVVMLQHPGGYGDGATVIMPNGSSAHAIHFLFNGDNAGPHSVPSPYNT